ncbi:hypothetical protein TrST_g9115 [Triparma strigata]|uniref:Uncharacterized protein n=1 Tax=Triparma strigata TaxID=1606541 RepID=A0A9W7AIR6_9STRA|nr:hypothetical protein TrST_g9115 [Triparma strigata]
MSSKHHLSPKEGRPEFRRLEFDPEIVNNTPRDVTEEEDFLCVATSPGIEQADVDRRIRVHWNPRESESYDGIIDGFNVKNGRVHIAYDDGDEEWLSPSDIETCS